jgi:hypothetical protein
VLGDLLRQAGWLADAAHLGWHRWVIGYSHDRQQDLLERLGLGFLAGYRLALATVIGTGLALLLGTFLLRSHGRTRPDPVQNAYQRFRKKLSDRGLETPGWLGPRQLGLRAEAAFPQHALDINRIVNLYIGLRYGRVFDKAQIVRLQRLIKSLRLR